MVIKYLLTSLAVILVSRCCDAKAASPLKPASKSKEAEPHENKFNRFDSFDWDLCKLVANASNDNVLISPVSVKLILGILYEGSDGGTAKDIESVLQVSSQDKSLLRKRFNQVLGHLQAKNPDYTLYFGSSTFMDQSIKPHTDFNSKLKNNYNSSLFRVTFQQPETVVEKVNSWAKAVTEGFIEKFLYKNDIAGDEIMLLANILFFKGQWLKAFDPQRTGPRIFQLSPKRGVRVPFMNIYQDFYYLNASDVGAQIIKLPYLGEQFCMYIILPNKKHGLQELIEKLEPAVLRDYFSRMTSVKVMLSLPKFAFDSTVFLKPFLQELGIRDMFTEKANLSKISADPNVSLVVTNILQKAGLVVEESGSTAYAITEAHLANRFGDADIQFSADHPFIFTIEHEKAKIPVFTGKLTNPANKLTEVLSLDPADTVTETPAHVQTVKINTTPASTTAGDTVLSTTPLQTQTASVPLSVPSKQQSSPAPLFDFLKDSYLDTRLLESLYLSNNGQNVFVSPASVKLTLAMLLEGANGYTASELKHLMKVPNNPAVLQQQIATFQDALTADNGNVSVLSASCLFVSENSKISPYYESVATKNYHSGIMPLNFKDAPQSSAIVNDWVDMNTHGMIKQLISKDDVDPELELLLVHTLFFKGNWETAFPASSTSPKCFISSNGKCTKVPMMEGTAFFNHTNNAKLNAQILELPYIGHRYSMIIILPSEPNGIERLIKDLSAFQLETLLSKMHPKKVQVVLPRFSVEHTAKLVPTLRSLGLRNVFSQNSELTGILDGGKPVKVEKIVQKAKIVVDETGSTAAAASGSFVVPLISSSLQIFIANSPFAFFIKDRQSGVILFEGILSQPESFSPSQKPQGIGSRPDASLQGDKITGGRPQLQSFSAPPPRIPIDSKITTPIPPNSNNYEPSNPLSTLMVSTQNVFNNLNQPDMQASSYENAELGTKVPAQNSNKVIINMNGPKNGVAESTSEHSELISSNNYQQPTPSDKDAIFFSANKTESENIPEASTKAKKKH